MLDGDRKAFHENAEWTKRKNHEKVEKLRGENKELRFKLKDLLAVNKFLFKIQLNWSILFTVILK